MDSRIHNLQVYRELADWHESQGKAPMRDRFLVLAADAAHDVGHPEEAERLRQRLLRSNPHHMLKPYTSFAQALRAHDVLAYIHDLRMDYPPDMAATLLASLQAEKNPSALAQEPPATPPSGMPATPSSGQPAPPKHSQALPPTAPVIELPVGPGLNPPEKQPSSARGGRPGAAPAQPPQGAGGLPPVGNQGKGADEIRVYFEPDDEDEEDEGRRTLSIPPGQTPGSVPKQPIPPQGGQGGPGNLGGHVEPNPHAGDDIPPTMPPGAYPPFHQAASSQEGQPPEKHAPRSNRAAPPGSPGRRMPAGEQKVPPRPPHHHSPPPPSPDVDENIPRTLPPGQPPPAIRKHTSSRDVSPRHGGGVADDIPMTLPPGQAPPVVRQPTPGPGISDPQQARGSRPPQPGGPPPAAPRRRQAAGPSAPSGVPGAGGQSGDPARPGRAPGRDFHARPEQELPGGPVGPHVPPAPRRRTAAHPPAPPAPYPGTSHGPRPYPPTPPEPPPRTSTAEPQLTGGAWLGAVLFGVVVTVGLSLAVYTLASPFIPFDWLQ